MKSITKKRNVPGMVRDGALWKRWASKEQSRTQTQTRNRFDRVETKKYDF